MSRVAITGNIVKRLTNVATLLDVGCRDGELRRYIPSYIEYFGLDLFPAGGHVRYVGDITTMAFDGSFDVVTAVDILEHLDQPAAIFDKLVTLTRHTLIVSLPNCYDLKYRYAFAIQGRLGGKYKFLDEETVDRHRWIMGATEIVGFYQSKAQRHGLTLRLHPVRYGSATRLTVSSLIGRLVSTVLPSDLVTHSIVGEFTRGHTVY